MPRNLGARLNDRRAERERLSRRRPGIEAVMFIIDLMLERWETGPTGSLGRLNMINTLTVLFNLQPEVADLLAGAIGRIAAAGSMVEIEDTSEDDE